MAELTERETEAKLASSDAQLLSAREGRRAAALGVAGRAMAHWRTDLTRRLVCRWCDAARQHAARAMQAIWMLRRAVGCWREGGLVRLVSQWRARVWRHELDSSSSCTGCKTPCPRWARE